MIIENNTVYRLFYNIEKAVPFSNKLAIKKGKKGISLSIIDSVRYVKQIAIGLKELHSRNIVHLNITLETILCDSNDNAVLTDISFCYLDEQAVKFSEDIYQLGKILYSFLTGLILSDEEVDGLQFPKKKAYLDAVIAKMLHPQVSNRYQTIDDFLMALEGEKQHTECCHKAKEAANNKQYDKAIRFLNDSQKYIPLDDELRALRLDFQKELQKNNPVDVQNVQALIWAKRYQEALKLLELLPEDSNVEQQINDCKRAISDGEKTERMKLAERYFSARKYEDALREYFVAKNIDVDNLFLDRKIDEIQRFLFEKQRNELYKKYIKEGDIAFSKGLYDQALEAYYKAKENATISIIAVKDKIQKCIEQKKLPQTVVVDRETLLKKLEALRLPSIEDVAEKDIFQLERDVAQIIKLIEDYSNKYVGDIFFKKELETTKNFKNHILSLKMLYDAEHKITEGELTAALDILESITLPDLQYKVKNLQNHIKNSVQTASKLDSDGRDFRQKRENSVKNNKTNKNVFTLLNKRKKEVKMNKKIVFTVVILLSAAVLMKKISKKASRHTIVTEEYTDDYLVRNVDSQKIHLENGGYMIYTGKLQGGLLNDSIGKAMYYSVDNKLIYIYEGIFSDGINVGTGMVTGKRFEMSNSTEYDYFIYTGNVKNGKPEDIKGIGTYYKSENPNRWLMRSKGEYRNGKRNGFCEIFFSDFYIGKVGKKLNDERKQYKIIGTLKNDKLEGKGIKIIYKAKNYIVADMKDDIIIGKFTEYDQYDNVKK